MQNSSNDSAFLTLSKQLESFSMIQKYSRYFGVSKDALSSIQQTAQIQEQLKGVLNSSNYIKQSRELQKQFQDAASVTRTVTSLQGVLKTVSSLNSWQTACFDSMSPIKASRIKSVAEGIQFHDEHVELTSEARETLDSIPDEPVPAEPDKTETPVSLSEPEPPVPGNAVNSAQPVMLPFKEFVKKYADRLIALTSLCFMIVQTIVPSNTIANILTEQVVPYVQNISAFCDECRHYFAQNDIAALIDAYNRNTESNKVLDESNKILTEACNHFIELYEKSVNPPEAEDSVEGH